MKKLAALMMALVMICLAGCGGAAKTADLGAVQEALSAAYDLTGMMALSEDDLLDMYGIRADDVKQYVALVAKTSTSADEILLFEAKDADAAARIRDKVDKRYQAKLNEAKDYLPEEYAKISACKVLAAGNFVALIVSADAEAMVKVYQNAFK